MNKKYLTAWVVFNKQGHKWEFNHVGVGAAIEDKPVDNFNRGWSKMEWRKQIIEIDADVLCPKITLDSSLFVV